MGKISVIITTFNRPHLIGRAVESAKRAGRDIEVIVVDDASIDETAYVCQKLEGIKYVRTDRNLGVAGARNLGIAVSSSEYITFLDDDDLRLDGSLDDQLAFLKAESSAGLIYGQVLFGDEECLPKNDFYPRICPQGDVYWHLLESNFIPCQSVIFRRECLENTGLLDETAAGIDDWDLWIRIAEVYPVLAVTKPVAIWRQPTFTSGQMSCSSEKMHYLAHRLHRDKWLKLPRSQNAAAGELCKITRRFAENAAQQLIWEAVLRLKTHHFIDFARVITALLRLYPLIGIKIALSKPTWRYIARFFEK